MANLRYLRIPLEMRVRKQWAVASLTLKPDGKPDKAPINPLTGQYANSTSPDTWCTFEEAVNSGYPAIGFMLSASDPFAIIDLDDHKTVDRQSVELSEQDRQRQLKIYETFNTYAERSQSGRGLHIVVKAEIGGGTNRDGVEAYDRERFMICTGDVVRQTDIQDYNDLLNKLVTEMGGIRADISNAELPQLPERYSDDEIIQKLETASNGDKFKDLFYKVPGPGDDWSRRDSQLAQMIAFHTRNHDQAMRLFRRSGLYRPHGKGKNPQHYEEYYLARTFAKAYEHEKQADADIDHGRQLVENMLAGQKHQPEPSQKESLPLPPGLVGEVAEFILGAAQRPVPEIAIAGALTFCSGIFGRQFNVSNTGLNLYVVLLTPTGRGKEGAASGIDMLMSSLRPNMPIVDEYRGPGHIASGQALVKHMSAHEQCFSFLGEFGHTLRVLTAPNANAADLRTKQVLLDLFSKSGRYQTLHSSVYADSEKNTKSVQAPCFAFMGDTTPEGYYNSVNATLVAEGLVPRFLTISYNGPRVPRNRAPIVSPSQALQDRLAGVFTSLANMYHSGTFVDIAIDPSAQVILDDFDKECDKRINGDSGLSEMWNRAHLKVLRVSAVLAVGRNHFEPRVDVQDVEWAINLVTREIEELDHRFAVGAVGEGEVTHNSKVHEAVQDYIAMPWKTKHSTYKVPKLLEDDQHVIPYGYFRRRLKRHASFQNHRFGLVRAIKDALADAVETGLLERLSEDQVAELNLKNAGKAGRPMSGEFYVPGPNYE